MKQPVWMILYSPHQQVPAGFLYRRYHRHRHYRACRLAFFSCGFFAGPDSALWPINSLRMGNWRGHCRAHPPHGRKPLVGECQRINSRLAARAVLSTVKCDNHVAEKRIARGVGKYLLHQQPARP